MKLKVQVQKMLEYAGFVYLKNMDLKRAMQILKKIDGAVIIESFDERHEGEEIAFDIRWISVVELNEQKYKGGNDLSEFVDSEYAERTKEIHEKNKKIMRGYVEEMERKINSELEGKEEIEFENYNVKFI